MVLWSCLCFPFTPVPTSTSLAWSLTESTPSNTMCVVLFLVSLKELIFWGWWSVSLQHLCYFVAIMYLFSQSLSIVLRCCCQLPNVTISFSSGRFIRWPGFNLIRASCRCVIDVMLLHCVNCTRLIRIRSLFGQWASNCFFQSSTYSSLRLIH